MESYSYILKGTYTGTIGANSSVSLGFIGVQDGEPEIISSSLTEVVVDENAILAASAVTQMKKHFTTIALTGVLCQMQTLMDCLTNLKKNTDAIALTLIQMVMAYRMDMK